MPNDISLPSALEVPTSLSCVDAAKEHVEHVIDTLLASLPDPDRLTADERCRLIARYTAVLEGNFIYWMTATYLSVRSAEAHAIIMENLQTEVRDNHPGMLRRFAVAARATSTDLDRGTIDRDLQQVRGFVARLAALDIVLMMAFFEGFIARFMPYLAGLATRLGSSELEYTDVHGVVDISHTEELFRAFASELAITPDAPALEKLLGGVALLRTLIETVIHPK
jgi:hypothetical protein